MHCMGNNFQIHSIISYSVCKIRSNCVFIGAVEEKILLKILSYHYYTTNITICALKTL